VRLDLQSILRIHCRAHSALVTLLEVPTIFFAHVPLAHDSVRIVELLEAIADRFGRSIRVLAALAIRLHAQRLAQKCIASVEHLCPRTRIVEIVIQVFPCDQLALGAGRGQTRRHALGLIDADISVERSMEQQYRDLDSVRVFGWRAFVRRRCRHQTMERSGPLTAHMRIATST
jgi:hypothetical protein